MKKFLVLVFFGVLFVGQAWGMQRQGKSRPNTAAQGVSRTAMPRATRAMDAAAQTLPPSPRSPRPGSAGAGFLASGDDYSDAQAAKHLEWLAKAKVIPFKKKQEEKKKAQEKLEKLKANFNNMDAGKRASLQEEIIRLDSELKELAPEALKAQGELLKLKQNAAMKKLEKAKEEQQRLLGELNKMGVIPENIVQEIEKLTAQGTIAFQENRANDGETALTEITRLQAIQKLQAQIKETLKKPTEELERVKNEMLNRNIYRDNPMGYFSNQLVPPPLDSLVPTPLDSLAPTP